MASTYIPPAACDIQFRRTGIVNPNGSVAGELRIREQKWPTMERGVDYTFVRKGVASGPLQVGFATSNGTAIAGVDYVRVTNVIFAKCSTVSMCMKARFNSSA